MSKIFDCLKKVAKSTFNCLKKASPSILSGILSFSFGFGLSTIVKSLLPIEWSDLAIYGISIAGGVGSVIPTFLVCKKIYTKRLVAQDEKTERCADRLESGFLIANVLSAVYSLSLKPIVDTPISVASPVALGIAALNYFGQYCLKCYEKDLKSDNIPENRDNKYKSLCNLEFVTSVILKILVFGYTGGASIFAAFNSNIADEKISLAVSSVAGSLAGAGIGLIVAKEEVANEKKKLANSSSELPVVQPSIPVQYCCCFFKHLSNFFASNSGLSMAVQILSLLTYPIMSRATASGITCVAALVMILEESLKNNSSSKQVRSAEPRVPAHPTNASETDPLLQPPAALSLV